MMLVMTTCTLGASVIPLGVMRNLVLGILAAWALGTSWACCWQSGLLEPQESSWRRLWACIIVCEESLEAVGGLSKVFTGALGGDLEAP